MTSATLPDASRIELADLGSSDTPRIGRNLARLGWQFLERLADFLLAKANRVMLRRGAMMPPTEKRPAASALDVETVLAEVVEAHRQFDAIVRQLGYLKV
ncbi:hypothetical protein [Rhodopila sp.]|uniref:hypothetical protein n=1 Tax=Rhodopila sp. TaxID=2480087 RepID=UPI003D0A5113